MVAVFTASLNDAVASAVALPAAVVYAAAVEPGSMGEARQIKNSAESVVLEESFAEQHSYRACAMGCLHRWCCLLVCCDWFVKDLGVLKGV